MKLNELIALIGGKIYNENLYNPNKEIEFAFGADLMSDALMALRCVEDTSVCENAVLLTGLVTNQSIRTAELLDFETVIFVRGKVPSQKVIDQANESNILLISTEYTMYLASGHMFRAGINGIDEYCEL